MTWEIVVNRNKGFKKPVVSIYKSGQASFSNDLNEQILEQMGAQPISATVYIDRETKEVKVLFFPTEEGDYKIFARSSKTPCIVCKALTTLHEVTDKPARFIPDTIKGNKIVFGRTHYVKSNGK